MVKKMKKRDLTKYNLKQPTASIMIFSYFVGVFAAGIPKTAWYMWLLPCIPLFTIFLLEWVWCKTSFRGDTK